MAEAKEKIRYFRVRRGLTTSGFFLKLSSDFCRLAVFRLWDKAKDLGGVFDSEAQLKELMGKYYRYVPELRREHWLDGLEVHDWDEDQVNPEQQKNAGKRSAEARRKLHGTAQPPKPAEIKPSNDRSNAVRDDRSNGSPERPFGKSPVPRSNDRSNDPSNGPSRTLSNQRRPRPETEGLTGLPRNPRTVTSRPTRARAKASSDKPPKGYVPTSDPDVWLSPDGNQAWTPPPQPPGALDEVRLRTVAPEWQKVVHASFGRIRRLLTDHPGYTLSDLNAAVSHPSTVAEAPKDVFAFVTAPYASDGLTILERCYRRRIDKLNGNAHDAVREEERDGAESLRGILARATANATPDPDDAPAPARAATGNVDPDDP
jgi:hypothetical protein